MLLHLQITAIDRVVTNQLFISEDSQEELINLTLKPFDNEKAQPLFVRDAHINDVNLFATGKPSCNLRRDVVNDIRMQCDVDALRLAGKVGKRLGPRILGDPVE